jgi:quercetin dioxygenase-like cupin family protein
MTENQGTIAIGGLTIDYLIDGSAARSVGMFELSVEPGAVVPPPHSHADNDEYIYGLAGTLRYSIDGAVRDICAGDYVNSPRGSVHGFSNPFDEPARVLIIQSPDIGRQYFADIREALAAPGPPDRAKIGAIMANYNLKVASVTS